VVDTATDFVGVVFGEDIDTFVVCGETASAYDIEECFELL
jgi:hypothetical protein